MGSIPNDCEMGKRSGVKIMIAADVSNIVPIKRRRILTRRRNNAGLPPEIDRKASAILTGICSRVMIQPKVEALAMMIMMVAVVIVDSVKIFFRSEILISR